MRNRSDESTLEKTLRLLALLALEGKPQKERIRLLEHAGFGLTEIATIVGSTTNAVSVRLAELRRAQRTSSKK
jgi:DNA-directed RNA polymerase specialized sigma24 family protein